MSEAFALYLQHRYGLRPDQLEVLDVPGYWRMTEPCGVLQGGCKHPIHATLFREMPIQHTIQYLDPPRDEKGRFADRYRTWKRAREEAAARLLAEIGS